MPENQDAPNLIELLKLPENWDSYGALKIKEEAVQAGLEILESLLSDRKPIPSVVPMPSGNIQLEWHTGGIDLEVEVISRTSLHVAYENLSTGEEWEKEFRTDLSELAELITALSDITQ